MYYGSLVFTKSYENDKNRKTAKICDKNEIKNISCYFEQGLGKTNKNEKPPLGKKAKINRDWGQNRHFKHRITQTIVSWLAFSYA
jgi:hypothetical protein